MNVRVRNSGAIRLLDLQGSLSLGLGDIALREAVQVTLAEGCRRIVLNVAGVIYLDSAGLGEILACHKKVRQHGGELRLLNPPPKVFEMLATSRLTSVLEVFTDEGEALASF